MMTLPSSVKIYVAAMPVDARKSFDGLSQIVAAEFGKDPLSGHLFVFINRCGHQIQTLFWDRNGYSIMRKRLESGTFRLATKSENGAVHVEISSGDLALMLKESSSKGRHNGSAIEDRTCLSRMNPQSLI